MSGHTKWSELKASRGLTGKWVAVAGDDRVKHYFTDTVKPRWWQAAKCGKGPAVGDSPSDARLGTATSACRSSARTSRTSGGSMADRFELPDMPSGLHLLWWLFDGQRWQLVVGTDPEDTSYQGLGLTPTDALHQVLDAIARDDQSEVDQARHPTVPRQYRGESIDIDEQLGPLLDLVWAEGIETVDCCQGGPGKAHIGFESAFDAERFIAIAAGEEDPDVESLWNRITRSDEPADNADWDRWRRERLWEYGGSPRVYADCIGIGVGAIFPPSDIPLLADRFRRHASG